MARKGTIPWNKGIKTNKSTYNSLNLNKEELNDLYWNQELSSTKIAKKYNCTSTTINNWLKRFNIPRRSNSEAVKLERSKWSKEKELARSIKYHNTWLNKPQEEKDESLRKRLASPNINSPEAIMKANETRLHNGTTNTSKAEENFKNKLLILGVKEDDIIHPYVNDPRYPFNCDFYIKSKDLFIEYQGHYSHGEEPWNNNLDQQEYLLQMKNKNLDMSTWIKRDPYKLDIAKRNNIKLLLIYPRHNNYLLKDGEILTIDINDINKI